MDDNKINVGGRLHSIATGNVLVGADEILDDTKNKKQSDINTETYALVNEINAKLATLSPEQQSALSVATKANKNEANLGYYVCDTEANVAEKIVANATGYMLAAGGSIKIKMNNTNDVNNVTLDINSTGNRPLYYNGKISSATNTWEAGETVEVYFDGDNYYANNVSNGGKFATGEKVNDVHIVNDLTTGGNTNVLSAEQGKNLARGFSEPLFVYSAFEKVTSTNGNILLSDEDAIGIYQEGDYVEIDMNDNGSLTSTSDTCYPLSSPRVGGGYDTIARIMLTKNATNIVTVTITPVQGGNSISYQSNNNIVSFNDTERFLLRIECTSYDSTTNIYMLDVYINGVRVKTDEQVTAPAGIYWRRIGNKTQMLLFSIKNKKNGVVRKLGSFAEMTGAVGVTDTNENKYYDGVVELNNRTENAENRTTALERLIYTPAMYYRLTCNKSRSYWNCSSYLEVMQRLKGNLYTRIVVGYYDAADITEDRKPSIRGYWRIVGANLVTITEGVVANYSDSNMIDSKYSLLTGGENEFVLQYQTKNLAGNWSGDFTGGFHYGETITDEQESYPTYVEFISDDNIIPLDANIPLTPCKSFKYRELSNIYKKEETPSLAATHFKETIFKDCGYSTSNLLRFVQALPYFAYFGIVCVERYVSENAMQEGDTLIKSLGDGSSVIANYFPGSHKNGVHYEGHGFYCDINSKLNFGADDSNCDLAVYGAALDSTTPIATYNKFYRRNPNAEGSVNNRLEGTTVVKFGVI